MSSWKKILMFAGIGLLGIIFLFAFVVLLEIARSAPIEETVKREFLIRYPNATIKNVELIFEQDGGVVYLITAREDQAAADGKYDSPFRDQTVHGNGVTIKQSVNANNVGTQRS